MKKHVLLVCYGGGHMKVMAPLYPILSEHYKVSILALTSAGSYLKTLGIPHFTFRDFSFTQSERIQGYGRKLAGDITPGGPVPVEETIAYLGASFADLVDQLGSEERAYSRYAEQGRAAFLPLRSLEQIIDELQPDAVITTNSPRAERAALMVAKARGLPGICINDNLWIKGGVSEVAEQKLASRICVLSEGVRQRLLAETNIAPEAVIVTGTPVFDALKTHQRVPGNSQVPRVLLADCELPDKHPFLGIEARVPGVGEAVRAELNHLASRGVIEVFLRPHPSQQFDYSRFDACRISPVEEDLHERLALTDVVVTAISTVGLEGKVMGLGLVSIEGTVYSTVESYQKLGMSTGIAHAKDLERAISAEFALIQTNDVPGVYPGLAADNIAVVLDSMFR